jgi:thiosulfate/3-mercaptopyruvate sulfurtransferase
MRAARVAWMLEYVGMKNPVMLEGGFKAWQDSKYPIETKSVFVVPRFFEARPVPMVLATAEGVRSISKSGAGRVLDVRSLGEYEGSEKRDCCPRSGRVPGAVWLEWTNFLNGKGGFQGRSGMNKRLESLGVHPNTAVAIYCHRGARAAAAFYALRSMGYNRAKNYVGSWHEWSSKRKFPTETGRVPTT